MDVRCAADITMAKFSLCCAVCCAAQFSCAAMSLRCIFSNDFLWLYIDYSLLLTESYQRLMAKSDGIERVSSTPRENQKERPVG